MEYNDDILQATIEKSIKWLRRYEHIDIDLDTHIQILWLALKGLHCKTKHIDAAQESSLLKFLEEHKKDINDPYIKEFMKERMKQEEYYG